MAVLKFSVQTGDPSNRQAKSRRVGGVSGLEATFQDFKFSFKIARVDGHFRPPLRENQQFHWTFYSS
jgi:hypothetical protein